MPESKEIKFDTKYKGIGLNGQYYNLAIVILKEADTPNTVEGILNWNLIDNYINNKKQKPGELLMIMKNHLLDIDYHIDGNGDLIVNAEDCDNYSIDDQGNLIYTYR